MKPPEPRYYMRPSGDFLNEPSTELIRADFLSAQPSYWNSEEGYAQLEHHHGIRDNSYLACGYVEGYGFFLSASLDRLTPNSHKLVPMTSNNFADVAQVWNGQSFTPVPRAFFVTPPQAADIAVAFWQTGNLLPIVQWVNPWEHGWDFT